MKIFISYRNTDSGYAAGRLVDRLRDEFRAENVFMDVDKISAGTDFEAVLRQTLQNCNVLVAVIGPAWLSASDEVGRRRIDDPKDWVRTEIETALTRKIRLIPVLVANASLPQKLHLPKSLRAMCKYKALEVRHDRFDDDVQELIKEIKGALPREDNPQVQLVKSMLDIGLGSSLRPDALNPWHKSVREELLKLSGQPLNLAVERLEFLLADWKNQCLEGIENCSTDDFWATVKQTKKKGKDREGLGDVLGAFLDLEMTASRENHKKKLRRINRALKEVEIHKKHTLWTDTKTMVEEITSIICGDS